MILDVYWSFFIGLGNFDPIRAMDFQARHLALATRVGDRKRLAVSLAAEALTHAASGGDESKKTRELFAAARAFATPTQAPEATRIHLHDGGILRLCERELASGV